MKKETKLKSRWSLKTPLYLKKTDNRYADHAKQLKTNGFSDTETWGLDAVIAEFILPRLIRFKEVTNGYPTENGMTLEKWKEIIDKMIFSFEWSLNHEDEKYDKLTEEERLANWEKYEEGIILFAEWFRNLWW